MQRIRVTNGQLAGVLSTLLTDPFSGEIDDQEAYETFVTKLGSLVCDYCGGQVVEKAVYDYKETSLDWTQHYKMSIEAGGAIWSSPRNTEWQYAFTAAKAVSSIAEMRIWDYDDDNGVPYAETEEPDEGYEDSHNALMSLIEDARKIVGNSAPSIDNLIAHQLAAIGHRFLREYDSELHDGTMRELVAELDVLEAKKRGASVNEVKSANSAGSDPVGEASRIAKEGTTTITQHPKTQNLNTVPVAVRDARCYGNADGPDAQKRFEIVILDERASAGYIEVCCADTEGLIDDFLSVRVDVSRLPEETTELSSLTLHFDSCNTAGAIYKVNDAYVIEPEDGVSLEPITLANGKKGYKLT